MPDFDVAALLAAGAAGQAPAPPVSPASGGSNVQIASGSPYGDALWPSAESAQQSFGGGFDVASLLAAGAAGKAPKLAPQTAPAPAEDRSLGALTLNAIGAVPNALNTAFRGAVNAPGALMNAGLDAASGLGLDVGQSRFPPVFADSNPTGYQPRSMAARGAYGATDAAANAALMMIPGAGMEVVGARMGGALGDAMAAAGRGLTQPLGGVAAPVAAGGAVQGAAQPYVEELPQGAQPYVNLGLSLAGGLGAEGAMRGVGAMAGAVQNWAGSRGYGPKTDIGEVAATDAQADQAATTVRGMLGDQGVANVTAPTADYEPVKGAPLTTAQVAQTGVAKAAENTVRITDPATNQRFADRYSDQNAAYRGVIGNNGAPLTASMDPLVDTLQVKQSDIAAQGQAATGAAQSIMQGQADALGGLSSKEDIGGQFRALLQNAYDQGHPAVQRLWRAVDPDGNLLVQSGGVAGAGRQALDAVNPGMGGAFAPSEERILAAASQIGPTESFSNLQTLRSNLGAVERQLRAQPGNDQALRRLGMVKSAIDDSFADTAAGAAQASPEVAQNIKSAGQRIVDSLPMLNAYGPSVTQGVNGLAAPEAEQLRGALTDAAPHIASMGDQIRSGAIDRGADLSHPMAETLATIQAARQAGVPIAAQVAQGGVTPAAQSILRAAYGEDLSGQFNQAKLTSALNSYARIAAEQSGVALSPAQIFNEIGARASGAGTAEVRSSAGPNAHGQSAPGNGTQARGPAANPARPARGNGRQGSAGEIPGAESVDQAGQRAAPPPVAPQGRLAGPDDVAAIQAARAATLAEKQTFRTGVVGDILRPGPSGTPFRVPEGQIPGRLTSGATATQNLRAVMAASGSPEQAAALARETLANDLRTRGIIKPDGTIHAAKLDQWIAQRRDILNAAPGLREQFANAHAAARTFEQVSAEAEHRLKAFQDGAAKHFLSGMAPQAAVQRALSSPTAEQNMRQLVGLVQHNPDAVIGLKRAVNDYILSRFSTTSVADEQNNFLSAPQFRRFIDQNKAALRVLYGGQGMQNLEAVAAALRRNAVRPQAAEGSETAQRLFNARKSGMVDAAHGSGKAIVLGVLGEHLGELLAAHVGGGLLAEAAGTVALPYLNHLLSAMRQRGIETTRDLVREAMLNPSVARELLARTPQGRIPARQMRRLIATLSATSAAQTGEQGNRKQ